MKHLFGAAGLLGHFLEKHRASKLKHRRLPLGHYNLRRHVCALPHQPAHLVVRAQHRQGQGGRSLRARLSYHG